jgi:hypothetical protein
MASVMVRPDLVHVPGAAVSMLARLALTACLTKAVAVSIGLFLLVVVERGRLRPRGTHRLTELRASALSPAPIAHGVSANAELTFSFGAMRTCGRGRLACGRPRPWPPARDCMHGGLALLAALAVVVDIDALWLARATTPRLVTPGALLVRARASVVPEAARLQAPGGLRGGGVLTR